MNKPLPVSLPNARVSSGDPAAPPEQVATKRAYCTPTMVEFGNVRDLTRGTGVSGKDKSGTRRTGKA